jgi:2-phosphosulfolactate phosphatase
MKVDVVLSVSYIKQEEIQKKTVIVIDSLRATSTILTALYQGATKVIPVETVGQALQYYGKKDTLLIGERYSKKVSGFDLGNSPQEVSKIDLTKKNIVITSTNGTKALQKVKKASHILVGCFLNATHCIERALCFKKDIVIVCAGRRGQFAIEDGLAAGMMVNHLSKKKIKIEFSDIALMLKHNFDCNHALLIGMIQQGETGRRLLETDQEDDIHFCLQLDHYPINAVYEKNGIVQLTD